MFHKASFLYIFYVILKRFSFLLDILTFVKEAKVEKNPSKIFIQVGTNDLTVHKDVTKLHDDLMNAINQLAAKFPGARTYVSTLLPRKDDLNAATVEFNKLLDNTCDTTPGIRLVTHVDITRQDLYDNLHLHNYGFFKFVCNINRIVFGIPPPKKKHR